MCTDMMHTMTGWMAGGMIAWAVLLVGLLAVGAVGISWLAQRGLAPARHREALEDGPRDILRRRYAAGEIDEDEYLTRLSGLSQP